MNFAFGFERLTDGGLLQGAMEQVAGLADEQQQQHGVRKKQAEVVARSLRALRNGLGRLWRRRSATITDYDPTFRVSYLGSSK